MACLLLNRERLSEITVFWVNTGKNFPETVAMIEFAKSLAPNFVVVPVDRDEQNRRMGFPSDMVPVNFTALGQAMTGMKHVMVQSYFECCFDNTVV